MNVRKILLIFSVFSFVFASAQTKEDVEKIIKNYDLKKINELRISLEKKEILEKKEAYEAAERNGWPIFIKKEGGGFQELMKLTPDGYPIYYSTDNQNAAISTRTNYLNTGGQLGLNLDGQNMVARVWDGGTVYRGHKGFGTTTSRVTTVDDPSGTTYTDHGTHVTGTVIANSWSIASRSIKGMAFQASARTFNWTNDESEAVSEVALGMLVSNHSYGVPLISNGNTLPAWYVGSYVDASRAWDEIAYNAPYYLPVFSAGNNGGDANTTPIALGYDKLVGDKVAKNVLTVANAQDAAINPDGTLASVAINGSSSQGPTDDRRIKPDITGNGTSVNSLGISSDTSTANMTGTSMASPNVTGTLLLLQQHSKNLTNSFMRAATLKGLVCHTADDAGPVGPDPVFGWGLLNAKKAAETLSNNGLTSWVSEEQLIQGQTFTINVVSAGGPNNPLVASISWTDLPGEANNGQRLTPNDPFRSLINDLDIRVTKDGLPFYPWRLDVNDPTSPALNNGDNNVDNIEVVRIQNPEAGNYVITVTHKGNLVTGKQDFSLVVTGISSDIALISNSENVELCSNQTATYTFNYKQSGSGTSTFTPTGIPAGANVTITPTSLNANGTVTMTISNLSSVLPGIYNVGIIANNGIESEARTKVLKIYSSTFDASVPVYPSNGFSGTSTIVNLDWQSNSNVESQIVQVSLNPTFSSFVVNQTTTSSNNIVSGLNQDTVYYWRVIPSNRCGAATASNVPVFSFRTGIVTCGNIFTATDFSNAILPDVANSSASVPIVVTGGLTIGEVKVNLQMTHTYVQDMTITLQGPASIGSPVIRLLESACGSEDDINCKFVDSGIAPACSSVPAISGNIAPVDPLSSLIGLPADGTWTLLVEDPYNGDGGVITGVSIEICALTASLGTNDNVLSSLQVYPNPSKGVVNIDLAGNVTGDTTYELFDVQGRKVVTKVSSNTFETLNVENLSDGIYMLSIQNGNAKTTKKVVINK
ncbi:S8 family serine peptidase [Flavobacterium sp. HXWNR69]|uniref:S8 family serine peptidase n=1 Tax=Flavobacterium fragile TaxID=2949085 RepID=A0ABT0TEY0_9FLAO|nr:S8 family serine peptidase [Flavobacterium sp. HXWNR69]MCL9769529.1 S8 family serine peptidase [Flavobacterium sp. HXWNR69]